MFLKVCLFIGLFVVSLWIEESVISIFLYISDGVYLCFYLFQSLAIIDQSHALNDFWRDAEQLTLMLVTTIVTWVLSLGLLGLSSYLYYSLGSPVLLILCLTLGQAVMISAVSMLPVFEQGSLLTSGMVGTYLSYLCFDLLQHVAGIGSEYWQVVTACAEIIVAAVLVARVVISWRLSDENTSDSSKPLVSTAEHEGGGHPYEMVVFHIVLLMTGCFIATSLRTITYRLGTQSVFFLWTKVGIQGLTSLLYIWTLLAPVLLSGREFH